MKTVYTFEAEARARKGKGASRQLRREGRLPAVLYGKGQEPVNFSIDEAALLQAYFKGNFQNKLIEIKLDGKKFHVLPREVQLHPVTDRPEHVDFLKVDEHTRVTVKVPVKLLNTERCMGVKRGGALNVVLHQVEVVCEPDAIPSVLTVDVLDLGIGHSIHLSAIELPKGVVSAHHEDVTIVSVTGRGGSDASEEEAAA